MHTFIYIYICVCVCSSNNKEKEATDFEVGKGWRWFLGGATGKKGKKETDVILFQLKTYFFLKKKSL